MALRVIDNSLANANTPERCKKQVKTTAQAIQCKQQGCGVDENTNPYSNATESTVDYIASSDLKPVADPEKEIQGLIEGFDGKDWLKVCECLNNARRFALFHSSLLKPFLETLVASLVRAVKNPRSALCKTSIMASADIFSAFRDELLDLRAESMDNLVMQLLLKASQDKRFVCEEAARALDTMVKSMNPRSLLSKLQAYVSHSNPRVRAKAAVSISHAVTRMGMEELDKAGLVSLITMAVELLNDRLPDAREASRRILNSIYGTYTATHEQKQEAWEEFCQLNLTPIHAQSVVKLTCS